jgi:hypothetical protein
MAADVTLRGILSALREMRAICASAVGDAADGIENEVKQSRLEELKSEVTRLAESVAGLRFIEFRAVLQDTGSVESLDDSIGKVSGLCESMPDLARDSVEKLSAWMESLIRRGRADR